MKDTTARLIDEALVLEAQAGSAQALDLLVQRWQGRLHVYARRLLGRDDAAWDVSQEAWLGIVRGLSNLDDPQAFAGWAYRIVTNKCRDRLHKEVRQKELHERFVEENVNPRSSNRDSTELKDALNKLTGDMQAVLTLRYLEGFAVSEISEILGIAEGTVKSRLHRARDELRKILEIRP